MSITTLPPIVPETNDVFPTGLHKHKGSEVIDWEKLLGNNDILNAFLMNLIPPGTIQMYAAETAPDGYLLCDGSEVSREEYARLFAAIDTKFGSGDGTSTFNVPDMRNRFPLGYDANFGLGNVGGSDTVALKTTELPPHRHEVHRNMTAAYGTDRYAAASGTGSNTYQTEPTGGGTAHDNMPPWLALAFIIKT